mmetsp:Transcript_20802/g.32611  ORF Transcript_20802/g.32611 Transcript_20802/m.32611 type:complete len:80 (-) Transcript_20802:84-323(-)
MKVNGCVNHFYQEAVATFGGCGVCRSFRRTAATQSATANLACPPPSPLRTAKPHHQTGPAAAHRAQEGGEPAAAAARRS